MGIFGSTAPAPPGHLDLHSGLPFWLVANALGEPHARLAADLNVDVAIVGGGITGALCNYAFSKAGLSTAVLDVRSFGMGSTCASTALLQYEIDTPLHRLVELVGERNAAAAYHLSVQAVKRIGTLAKEVGYTGCTPRSSIQYASRPSHALQLRKEHQVRHVHGLPVELLDGREAVESVLPFAKKAALLCPVAAEIDAVAFTHALHRAAVEHGARLFEHTKVVEVNDLEHGVVLRTEHGPIIRAKYMVFATGYETLGHLPADVIDLNSTFAMISEPMERAPWNDQALIWETATPYLYMRTAPGGRIIVGGRDEPFRSPKLRDALLAKKTTALQRDFEKLFPDHPFKTEYSWCGTFGSTKDGLPYIDCGPQTPHCFFALGMGGNGITFSTLAADMICDRILGRAVPDMDLFRFDR